jgi:hypothetical protein
VSKDLAITKKTKNYIETIYCKWFVPGVKGGKLEIGISESTLPIT